MPSKKKAEAQGVAPADASASDHSPTPAAPLRLVLTGDQVERVAKAVRRERGAVPMKPDPQFDAAASNAYAVTAAELRQFVERIEQLEAEKRDLAEQLKEVMSEAKGRGYDTKVLRKLIALRKRSPDDIAEEEAVLEAYKAAMGMD